MITAELPKQAAISTELQMSGTFNQPLSLVPEQVQFLLKIEQLALGHEMMPIAAPFAREGVSPDLMPQLKSTISVVLGSPEPSVALILLQQAGMFRAFKEFELLTQTPQDSIWHPEGNAWVHTMMVVDQAASLLRRLQIELSATEQQGLMWGVLLHDIGKSFTTQTRIADRRIISPKHEKEGVAPARLMLEQLGVDADIAEVALAIVERHMAPPALHRELLSGSLNTASYERAVERLGRRIEPVRLEPLMVAAMADRLGRATPGSNEEKIAFALPMAEILKVSVADSFKEN